MKLIPRKADVLRERCKAPLLPLRTRARHRIVTICPALGCVDVLECMEEALEGLFNSTHGVTSVASTWRRGSRLEEMSETHNLSFGQRYQSEFRDRITTGMCSMVSKTSRRRCSDAETSTASGSALRNTLSTGTQHNSPLSAPTSSAGVATSPGILVTMILAAPSPASPRSDEVATMGNTMKGSCTPTSVQAAASSSHKRPVTDSRHKPSGVVCGRGRLFGGSAGGAVQLHSCQRTLRPENFFSNS
ncbi:hypothetical protein MRX96_024540 [Rhipicephalus microplus]